MTIKDLSAVITDINGNPLKEGEGSATIQSVIVQALLGTFPDEQSVTGDEKFRRFNLATRIHAAKDGKVDLLPEDIVLAKNLVGKGYGALVVGQVFTLLNA